MGPQQIMMGDVLLDTDILIDFLRGNNKAEAFISARADRIILSAIVVAELYAGVKGRAEREALDALVSLFRIVPVDVEIAKSGGLYQRDYGKSHGVGLADAILAATAEAWKAELKTLNIKHYPMLKGLRPAYTQ
jgi:predicted nucleic acid-binding protein